MHRETLGEPPFAPVAAAAPDSSGCLLLIAAHPDDETIGAAGLLLRLAPAGRCALVHLTDGAPRDGRFRASPFAAAPRERYAEVRRSELAQALSRSELDLPHRFSLGVPDQEAASNLAPLARRLARLFQELRPAQVVTHAYEGGHPDHDAAAFAVQAAARLLAASSGARPALFEMTSYHGQHGRLVTGRFLPAPGYPITAQLLSAEEEQKKRGMLACFESQRETLTPFTSSPDLLAVERFRPAPRHDFGRAPHPGPLWYESLGWPMTGEAWRTRARQALLELGLAEGPCA